MAQCTQTMVRTTIVMTSYAVLHLNYRMITLFLVNGHAFDWLTLLFVFDLI